MTVEHDAAQHAFVAHLEEGDAVLGYAPAGGAIDLQHTFVPEAARGRGAGDALVRAAFAWARANGRTVIPSCPFVRHWLAEHPDEGDVVGGR